MAPGDRRIADVDVRLAATADGDRLPHGLRGGIDGIDLQRLRDVVRPGAEDALKAGDSGFQVGDAADKRDRGRGRTEMRPVIGRKIVPLDRPDRLDVSVRRRAVGVSHRVHQLAQGLSGHGTGVLLLLL
jgi:hypothetical protein